MKKRCILSFLTALILFCICVPNVSALTVVTHFVGGDAPSNAVGGGNLEGIVSAAAKMWESSYSDGIVVTLYYGWADVGDAAIHSLQETDALGREISGTILFDNSGSVSFYLDPTPNSNEEYRRRNEEYQDLGSGMINVARLFTSPMNDAAGHVDLLSVALHEIGHALGLSSANSCFVKQSGEGILILSEELPFTGSIISLAYNNSGVIAHFDPSEISYGPVMAGINADERRIPSELDILANAQVSGFKIASLNPQQLYPKTARLRGVGEAESESQTTVSDRVSSATRGFLSVAEERRSKYVR